MIAIEIQFLTAAVCHVFLVQKWTSLKLALTENGEPQSQTDFRLETSRSCSSLWGRFEANLFLTRTKKNPWCRPFAYFSKFKVSLISHQVIRGSPYSAFQIRSWGSWTGWSLIWLRQNLYFFYLRYDMFFRAKVSLVKTDADTERKKSMMPALGIFLIFLSQRYYPPASLRIFIFYSLNKLNGESNCS